MAAAVQNPVGIISCTFQKLTPCEGVRAFSDTIEKLSCLETIQRVALGALACLAAYPIVDWAEHAVVDLMLKWGFDLSPAQDVMAVWGAMALFPTPLNVILLTAFLAYIVIIGPIFEEWLFRDLLQGCLEGTIENPVLRTLANGTLFGAAHLSPFQGWTNVPIFIATGLMGIIFAALREATGDVVSSSTTHMLVNGTSMSLFLLG